MPRTLGLYEEEEIQVNNGRFGPYLKHNGIFISIPKNIIPSEIDYEKAVELIKEKQKADAPIFNYNQTPSH